MKLKDIVNCLDCNYAGEPVRVCGVHQCPQCASRALWRVSCWSYPPELKDKIRQLVSSPLPAAYCCDIVPSFFGGREQP